MVLAKKRHLHSGPDIKTWFELQNSNGESNHLPRQRLST
ncbi:hypothetical protein AVEN_212204-1, partial [Araneus ventricosus]